MANATTNKPTPSTASKSQPVTKDEAAKPTVTGKIVVPDPTGMAHTVRVAYTDKPDENQQPSATPDTNPEPPPEAVVTTTTTLGFFNEDAPTLPEGKYGFRPLSKTEMDELADREETIRVGLPQFLAVAQALLEIKKKKLSRLYARSFADYCDKRLGISRVWAYMQASAAEAMQNLLASGEQMTLPTTERQLRPLAGLDAKMQVTVWKLALEKAAGKKVSGKQVEEAVKELSGDVAAHSEWLAKVRAQLTAAGYEADFVQPVDVGEKEWIDFLHEPTETYVKLIDAPTLSSMGICLAMREQDIRSQVVINGATLGKKKLTAHNDGTLDRLIDPVLSVFMHTLGAFLERNGVLYGAGEIGKDSTLGLKAAEGEDTQDLRAALDTQKPAQVDEEQTPEEQPVQE